MQTFIHIILAKPHQVSFDLPMTRWAKQAIPELVTFDFDNHSDASLADYAVELMNRSEKVLLFVHNDQGTDSALGGLMKVMQRLTRIKDKQVTLILQGEHAAIEKMSRVLKEGQFYKTENTERIKEKILSFFLP